MWICLFIYRHPSQAIDAAWCCSNAARVVPLVNLTTMAKPVLTKHNLFAAAFCEFAAAAAAARGSRKENPRAQ